MDFNNFEASRPVSVQWAADFMHGVQQQKTTRFYIMSQLLFCFIFFLCHGCTDNVVMEAITAANILTSETEEIPAKHHKSSGRPIRCLCLLRWLAILQEFYVSGQMSEVVRGYGLHSAGCQRNSGLAVLNSLPLILPNIFRRKFKTCQCMMNEYA